MTPKQIQALIERLEGKYTIPIQDGTGPLDGKDVFTRQFPRDKLPPIQLEAAAALRAQQEEIDHLWTLIRQIADQGPKGGPFVSETALYQSIATERGKIAQNALKERAS